MSYFDELKRTMEWIANEFSNSIFLGQAVEYPGTAMYNTLKDIDLSKRLELPVIEATQLGLSTGLAMNGFLPISIFPRFNFLLNSVDQIVNHLDKIAEMSDGGYNPKVIIRTSVGSVKPLDPQSQHRGNFSLAFRNMLTNINVIELSYSDDIFPSYKRALESDKSTILVEFADNYNNN